ncbi:MAG: thrombospondin type 3 repeat-containing protein, partial [Candidatus Altiarchaeota archaeon]|nr:thrombospondin type 3 repeat-containing protein [Candidatus Altiarchaeota archaeon]
QQINSSVFISDSDGDGIPDYKDDRPDVPDGPKLGSCRKSSGLINCTSDDDCGYEEKCRLSQSDADKDGVGDACDNCIYNANGRDIGTCKGDWTKYKVSCEVNSDCGKGICSLNQENSDGDEKGDACDNCPYKTNNQFDTDDDGVGDFCDNCPNKANGPLQGSCTTGLIKGTLCKSSADCIGGPCDTAQEDSDSDGVGDMCDKCPGKKDANQDFDGDEADDACDNCMSLPNTDQKDTDNDGIGDACDCNDGVEGPYEEGIDCGGTYHLFGKPSPCEKCPDICNIATLPWKFDWRNHEGKDWMTPVKDQGSCGSCWAQSAAGTVEAKYNIEQGTSMNLNIGEQYLMSGCKFFGGDCNGGPVSYALKDFITNGVGEEICYPYTSAGCSHGASCAQQCKNGGRCSNPPTCQSKCTGAETRWHITSVTNVSGDVETRKRAILCHGPLAASSPNWKHAIVIVGWNDRYMPPGKNQTQGVWIIKNSWGVNQNDDGYVRIPYHGDPASDMTDRNMYYVDGVTSNNGQ